MDKSRTQPAAGFIIFMLMITLAATSITSAQEVVDVLYLDNGNVIRGHLIEQPDSDLIRIETLCHNIYQYSAGEIASIRQETINTGKGSHYTPKTKGYNNITDFGLLAATGYNEKNAIFSILSTHNYAFGKGFSAGAGIGLELFEQPAIPLYASFTWQMGTLRFSPFIHAKAGYSFAIRDPETYWDYSINATGGMMLSSGFGTKIWVSHRNALVISLLYRYQDIHSVRTWEWTGETTELLKRYNRLELRFGFQF